MKKLLFTTITILLGISLNAQVSVWNGTAEPWTDGNGTEDSPYLIENAQNMAYLAGTVNDGVNYENVFFALTVDLDLGCLSGLEWTPIGVMTNKCFSGHFNGDSHKIFNIKILDLVETGNAGLFGNVINGSIKNIEICGNSNGDVYAFQHTGNPSGLLFGYGNNVVLDNCVNNACVVWNNDLGDMNDDMIGGLFGNVSNSTIRNCHNRSQITVIGTIDLGVGYFGGLAGKMDNCIVEKCSSRGIISTVDYMSDYIAMGGIAGCVSTMAEFTDCYSTVDMLTDNADDGFYAGGIVGYVIGDANVAVSDSYYAGTIGVLYSEGIVGYPNIQLETITVTNSHYAYETVPYIGLYGIPESSSFMKTQDFVDILNNGDLVYTMDVGNINNGYPIFSYEYDFIDDYVATTDVFAYPNPTTGKFTIQNICLGETVIEIFDASGRQCYRGVMDSQEQTIDISSLPNGIYCVILKTAESSKRMMIIKE